MDKTWLEVEMDESVTLVRKKLEELNDTEKDDVDEDVLHQIDKCYEIIKKISCIRKDTAKVAAKV